MNGSGGRHVRWIQDVMSHYHSFDAAETVFRESV